ncbi:MAG: DUF3592 domain-containing protein, partial [Bdellovibrionales bacterium]|nr:DUF3592 domain-containing protein [Bdellovibrionales bacterium]
MNFQFSNSGGRSKKTPGVFGKMGISLFLSVFLALGLFFFYMLGLEVISRASVFSWEKTQCHIQSSSIGQQSGDKQHVLRVKYSYEYKGVRYESDRFSMDDPEYDKYSKASQAIAPYEQGSTTDCYVNPKSPSEAVLSRGGLWIALFLLIPLIFIAVGGGGIYAVWTTSNDTAKSRYAKRATSRSASSNSWVGVIFGGVFFLVGLGLFYPFFVLPLMNLSDSQSWTPTDCTVISSSVKSHHSDDGTTYSVEIFYRYEVNGTTYKSDRYEFFGGSSSGYDSKKKVVRDHPPGKTFTCYVNPEAPSEAVINRGFSWSFLLGLIPLIFMVLGLAVMFLFGKTQKSTALPTHAREASTSFSFAEPLELKPTSSRMGKLLGITFAALFWNGIVSVFLYHVWESWSSGSPEWFL